MNSSIPHHIAIVMDGNGRWAQKRFLPRLAGHHQGLESLRHCVQACSDRGVGALTVFAFSSENWNRPKEEVLGLMDLFSKALSNEIARLHSKNVRLHFVGDKRVFSEKIYKALQEAEEKTAANTGLQFSICFNYGGRWDITQAACAVVASGQEMSEAALSQHLALAHVPDPDLLIRTGGEMRISNFLLWQLAYAELYFSPLLWPEFDEAALDQALEWYATRERRFGKISEQLDGRKVALPHA